MGLDQHRAQITTEWIEISRSRKRRRTARACAVGLGALLVAAPRGGVGRLGQVDLGADRAELLDDDPPPGRRLQRRLEPLANEPRQQPADLLAMGRRNARPADLAGLVSSHSAVIGARCRSSPITIAIRGLLKLHG